VREVTCLVLPRVHAAGSVEGASAADISGWSSDQVVSFLDKLLEYRSLTPAHKATTRAMDAAYHLSECAPSCRLCSRALPALSPA
jgi:hypothetical protein